MLQTNESQLQDTRRSCDYLSLKLLDYGHSAFTFPLSCFHNMKAKLLAIYFETCPVARCGCGHLIGVFSRDNGEVRVNKLQQRQIKNIWLINSSVQCGGGARPGSPACPHMAPQVTTLAPAQDLNQDIKLGRVCLNLSFVPPNHGHHPPSTGREEKCS